MDDVLIQKVKECEVIYDHRSPYYRDQHVRLTTWEEIGKMLNISGTEAKDRWDKLRRCFCNARNRRRDESKSGPPSRMKPLWKYEQQMAFLIPFIESRKAGSISNESAVSINIKCEQEDNLSFGSDTDTLQSDGEHFNFEVESELDERNRGLEGEEVTYKNGKRYKPTGASQNKKRQKSLDINPDQLAEISKDNSSIGQYNEGRKMVTNLSSSLMETMDDTDMFFHSMSLMTKKLPKTDQAQIKLDLSNAVLSAELKHQQLLYSTPFKQHAIHQGPQQSFTSIPSPLPSDISMTSG